MVVFIGLHANQPFRARSETDKQPSQYAANADSPSTDEAHFRRMETTPFVSNAIGLLRWL